MEIKIHDKYIDEVIQPLPSAAEAERKVWEGLKMRQDSEAFIEIGETRTNINSPTYQQSPHRSLQQAIMAYQQALGLFRAVGSRLGEANTLKAIGDVQQFVKETEAALQSYQQALGFYTLEYAPLNYIALQITIGDISMQLGEEEKASERYQAALSAAGGIEEREKAFRITFDLGYAFSQLKDHLRAVECYTQALSIDREHAMSYRNRAEAYIRLERFDAAEADCQAAESLAPEHPFTHARWGSTSTRLATAHPPPSVTGGLLRCPMTPQISILSLPWLYCAWEIQMKPSKRCAPGSRRTTSHPTWKRCCPNLMRWRQKKRTCPVCRKRWRCCGQG
jgi:tetratricopeptide (TPR) repeat protein